MEKRKIGGILAGLFFALGLLAIARWKLFQPKIKVATYSQIEQALPRLAWDTRPNDTDAILRMMRLFALSKDIKPSYMGFLTTTLHSTKSKAYYALQAWIEHHATFEAVEQLLRSGPLEYKPISDPSMESLSFQSIGNLAKMLALIGTSSAEDGNFQTCEKAIEIDLKLVDGLYCAQGGFREYLNLVSIVETTESAIQKIAALQSCPPNLCRTWLDQLQPTSTRDKPFSQTIEMEFQEYTLPRLQNPTLFMRDVLRHGIGPSDFNSPFEPPVEDYQGLGTFDPVPTARMIGKLILVEEDNAARPYSEYSRSGDLLVARISTGLPLERGRRGSFERMRFRLSMNSSDNSIGRALVAYVGGVAIQSCIRQSYRWRALHEATRVLLACVLYRKDHRGFLPPTLLALSPKYLRTIPVDPFNGQVMRYSASKQKVWSVGENLRDDGGDIGGRATANKDLGLYLEVGVTRG